MSTKNTRAKKYMNGFTKTIATFFYSSKPNPPPSTNSCFCNPKIATMLHLPLSKLRRLCGRLRWTFCSRPKTKVSVRRCEIVSTTKNPSTNTNGHISSSTEKLVPIRLATFNAALFSMAPAISTTLVDPIQRDIHGKAANDRPPKGILKNQKFSTSKRRVSINLPEDEISIERSKHMNNSKGKAPVVGPLSLTNSASWQRSESLRSERSVLDVLREVGADVIALQNVKAAEEKAMRPLSDLAEGLGMKYVFAESWAPEYGNAILSRWPIKQWKVQKIFDDADFRNILKATIDIPRAGEVNFHCTHLDHLDENWRMKQISTILRSSDGPHILAGGLNSLDETDYSSERWNDIVKYYEEIGKPTPKTEVMRFLKGKQYSDAKNFAGECESVVIVAKGQDVQGTCKYGTRVDYILTSPNSPYKFVPGSYGVISSKGTSDHHIVKVDIVIDHTIENNSRRRERKQKVVKIDKALPKGIWGTNS